MKYKELPKEAKDVIDLVKGQFADLFDNSEFGPFIQEFTHFDDDRYAQLFEIAMGNLLLLIKISGIYWTPKAFPYHSEAARGALTLSLTCEVIRHLVRSYVEIPDTSRVGAPDVVRREYYQRWKDLLNDYDMRLKDAAKKLQADIYENEADAGRYIRTLVDYPSMARGYIPFNPVERPQFGWCWEGVPCQ